MKVLITTPFFSNLGGSELETIYTANTFASVKEVSQIDVFVYSCFDLSFIENINIDSKIKFIKYPVFFGNKIIYKINKWTKKLLKTECSPLEFLFWKIKLLAGYNNVYIITKSTLSYYIPIIVLFKNKEKIVVKYTTVFFKRMPDINLRYLSMVRENLVTSECQKIFFQKELRLGYTSVQEVLIFNEEYALGKNRDCYDKSLYDFGILGRFTSEKQIEDAVALIENLKIKGYPKTLLIRGSGERTYYDDIVQIVQDKDLTDLITIEFESISYDKVFDFFDRINCFLITSKYEGGPNIGLEIMAYGLPILSYKVGAMPDRLKVFTEFIAGDMEQMVDKAITIINYTEEEFIEKCRQVKSRYLLNYSNSPKVAYIREFLIN